VIPLLGAFESTYLPAHDTDVAETSGHVVRRRSDLALLRSCGVTQLRYPIRWHRVETVRGRFDWRDTDEVMSLLADDGWHPIVDLVHHTSIPRWLDGGFGDPRFADAYLRYVTEFAERYPWVESYTLFNEPFSTLFLCGHEAVWPPYGRGMQSFVAMLRNVLPAVARASEIYTELLPAARHVHVDAAEHHTGDGASGVRYAEYANDRRFFVLDALLGRVGDPDDRPFVADVVAAGGSDLLELQPVHVDVLGLDYYAHCQWHFGPRHGIAPTPSPPPFADVIEEYWSRYGVACMVTETNIRGYPSDRASWLKYVAEQYEDAVGRGVQLEALCWFPFVDSCDWDSLLFECAGNLDPVGVVSVDDARRRRITSMTASFSALGHGASAAELPAYDFQQPVAGWLTGYVPQMSHWDWRPAPVFELGGGPPGDEIYDPLPVVGQ
jgi:beta-glucosidase/6-phospho-beta-glucosidase/beta-galactosidase